MTKASSFLLPCAYSLAGAWPQLLTSFRLTSSWEWSQSQGVRFHCTTGGLVIGMLARLERNLLLLPVFQFGLTIGCLQKYKIVSLIDYKRLQHNTHLSIKRKRLPSLLY
jgi:hypothetical protein